MRNIKQVFLWVMAWTFMLTLSGFTSVTQLKENLADDTEKQQQNNVVNGIVTDVNGEALIGANVKVKGTTNGTVTDVDGKFSLTVPENARLQVSFIGYIAQEIGVIASNDGKPLVISLVEDRLVLDEVVVIGYGTTSKRKTTASISTIAVDKLENIPSASIVNNLGGRTPGVFITPGGNGGGPGTFSAISIRGGGTPIVVIDGIVSDYNSFRDINQNDIASMSILKDAAAAAVYGSRAGNGIILVTTKRGENAPLHIDYSYSQNFTQPTVWPKRPNSYELANYTNQASANVGRPNVYTDEQIQKYKDGSDPYYYPNTDWIGLTFKEWAPEANHNLSIRGGDTKNKYYVGLGYFDQDALIRNNTNYYRRYNVRMNLENNFEKIGLKTTSSVNATIGTIRTTLDGFGEIWGHASASHTPFEPAYNDRGLYATTVENVLEMIDPRHGYNKTDTQMINGLFQAEWKVPGIEGFKLKSVSNYAMAFGRVKAWKSYAPQAEMGSDIPKEQNPPNLNETYNRDFKFTQQFLADYEHKFLDNDLSLGATLGYEFGSTKSDMMSASRENYVLDFDQFIAGPTTSMKNEGSEAESGRAGVIGRLKADYKAKYMIEANFRRDGSDWFPKDKRWGTFYSISAGWALSDESFMKSLKDNHYLDYFKLRASYGIIGLDGSDAQIDRFEYIPGYNIDPNTYVIDDTPVAGFSEGPLVSPNLTWYTLSSSDFGFDFSTLNETLYGGLDYFYYRTSGYLASPSGTRYTDPLGTSLPKTKTDGALRRAGWEGYLGYKNTSGDFSYDISGNLSYFDQLWEMNPDEQESTTKNPRTRDTHELAYNTLGYHSLGFFKDEADVMNSPKPSASSNLAPGDIKYEDVDGNGLIDSNDRIKIGKGSMPHITYGVNIDLGYKAWFLTTLIQGSAQRDIMLNMQFTGNQAKAIVTWKCQEDFWTETNTDARFPRLLAEQSYNGNNNIQTSDFWLISGNYLRLKSVQIGYDFKKSFLHKVPFLSNAKLILGGTNLITFADALKYGLDPELGTGSWYSYGTQRVYTLTFNIGF
ncbi:MAG: TonB-dependent receptor [Candidatus Symbiothrix sp.]|jgi:TonB-linked SusC/RagA family outer membrane protein|nr:TonB-dependent receptor [Candidatus Symbiothrix sp.]